MAGLDSADSLPVYCDRCGWEGYNYQLKKVIKKKDPSLSDHRDFEIETDACPECGSDELGHVTT